MICTTFALVRKQVILDDVRGIGNAAEACRIFRVLKS
jgi:hypothetical protein